MHENWRTALLRSTVLRAPDDGGAGGEDGDAGAGGDGDQGGGQSGEEKVPSWANALLGEIKQLNAFAATAAQQRQLEQQRQQQSTGSEDDDEDEGQPDPKEMELMSRADFGTHIVNQVLKAVNKQVVGPLNQQMQELAASATRNDVQNAVKEAAAQHKDFWDWREEMLAIGGQPGFKQLPPASLYILARAQNAAKAKELDAKYNPKPAGNGGPIRFKGFGGLTPSQTGTGSKSHKMNGTEAADAAWAETVKALGGEPMFEE